MSHDEQTPSPDDSLEGLDHGLAEAFGDQPRPSDPPSVLERISKLTGSRPQVSLRDLSEDESVLLKPLGPEEARDADKYAVHGELGRGGVGTVHRGHDHDLGRDVAMKFLHERYSQEPAILHRFVEEAQIGGQLQHPGIVPVYDLGMKDGKPFFTMKLVKGQTLAKKLADRSSPAEDRATVLSIFEDVCQTMAYAHARGVVHRDLKPANIMIGSFGEVQVVDWGMGKVLRSGGVSDEELAAKRHTEQSVIETVRSGRHGSQSIVGSVMGTPPYMPPEQALGDVEAMDERSDVFALGAILCEILTGQPPYVGEPADLILKAATCDLADAQQRLDTCGAEPDLVELVRQCLAPAPAARPRSAEVVAKVVHGHLASVQARLDDARVRAAEAQVRTDSLRRTQKLGMGFTAIIVLALVGTFVQWRAAETAREGEQLARGQAELAAEEARASEAVARQEAERAERELARAGAIKQLLADVLISVSPAEADNADPTILLGVLEGTTARLEDGDIEDSLARAEVEALVGIVYRNLGRFDEAEQFLGIGVAGLEDELGPDALETQIGRHNQAMLLKAQGKRSEAMAALEELLEVWLVELGPESVHTIDLQSNMAVLLGELGQLQEAEDLYRQVLGVRERVFGEAHRDTINFRRSLGNLLSTRGKAGEAQELSRLNLELATEAFGEEHTVTIDCKQMLGKWAFDVGRYEESAGLLTEVVEARILSHGPGHPHTLAAQATLAQSWMMSGQLDRAKEGLTSVLAGQRKALGEEHPRIIGTMAALAQVALMQGDTSAAETHLRDVLARQREAFGHEHMSCLGTMTNLGSALVAMERFDEAAELLEESLELKRRILGVEHTWTQNAISLLARSYQSLGRDTEALALHREHLELTMAALETPSAATRRLIQLAGSLLWHDLEELRDPAMARTYAERAVNQAEDTGDPNLWIALYYLGAARHTTGDLEGAAADLARSIDLMPAGATSDAAELLAEIEAAL